MLIPKPRVNFHTHTLRCRHATGDIDDYVREAIARGLTALGFTDHTPLPDHHMPQIRMGMSELAGYLAAIRRAATEQKTIAIFAGLECEHDPEYLDFFRELLIGEHKVDFLAGGTHWFPWQGARLSLYDELETAAHLSAYAAHLAASMQCGLYAYIAHPDFFARSYTRWDENAIAASRDILAAAESTGAILEINTYGFRKEMIHAPDGPRPGYPLPAFWRLAAEYKVRVLVNSDAHRPEDVAALKPGLELAARFGLSPVDLSQIFPKRGTNQIT